MPYYRHEAQVTFRGAFPLDMLRYDCSYPATSTDVGAIGDSLDSYERQERYRTTPPGAGLDTTVRICAISDRKPHFSIERWKSFGCTVLVLCRCCRKKGK